MQPQWCIIRSVQIWLNYSRVGWDVNGLFQLKDIVHHLATRLCAYLDYGKVTAVSPVCIFCFYVKSLPTLRVGVATEKMFSWRGDLARFL